MKHVKADVVIVGTGVSGLFAALHLPKDKKILMITKDELENSDRKKWNVYSKSRMQGTEYKIRKA